MCRLADERRGIVRAICTTPSALAQEFHRVLLRTASHHLLAMEPGGRCAPTLPNDVWESILVNLDTYARFASCVTDELPPKLDMNFCLFVFV